jgi:hypothetical protein
MTPNHVEQRLRVRSRGVGRFPLPFKTDAPTYFQRANDAS